MTATTDPERIRSEFYAFARAASDSRPSNELAVPFVVFSPPVNCCQQVRSCMWFSVVCLVGGRDANLRARRATLKKAPLSLATDSIAFLTTGVK